MAQLTFRYNDTTYAPMWITAPVTTPSLCIRQGTTTNYTPLLTSRSQTIDGYTYDASSPTICVRYNDTTYYAAKSRTRTYDIPAGTYTPSAFESLISNYISSGGSRTCSNQFTATVNGQTITVASGTSIYRSATTSDYAACRFIGFGTNTPGTLNQWSNNRSGFTSYKSYCVYANSKSVPYAKYSITIGTGINFN